MTHSHNLPLPLRIYPVLYKVTFPESTSSFQNLPPFSTTICDAPRIYPALQESTLPSQNKGLPLPLYMQPSQNLPIPSEYTPFLDTICAIP